MALHGEIKINHHTLLWWSAVRQEPLEDRDATHSYKVEAVWADPVTTKVLSKHEGTLLGHRYSDGAGMLAIKVIAWANAQRGEWAA